MMLAMFASKNREDWDDLLPAVMMTYRSSVHESTSFSPYRLMFGEECTLPMDIGLPKQQSDLPDSISSPYAVWVRDALEVAYEQVRRYSGQVVQRQKRLMTIAHAFNYRVVVLRDGARSAIRIGRSCKAETCFLTEANISWGQQVTVMFRPPLQKIFFLNWISKMLSGVI